MDDNLVEAMRHDYATAPISDQDRVMLDYVVKLTKDATQCSEQDHARLREVGFDDRGILQITLIAAWFNYINRVADALGVGRDWNRNDLIKQHRDASLRARTGSRLAGQTGTSANPARRRRT